MVRLQNESLILRCPAVTSDACKDKLSFKQKKKFNSLALCLLKTHYESRGSVVLYTTMHQERIRPHLGGGTQLGHSGLVSFLKLWRHNERSKEQLSVL